MQIIDNSVISTYLSRLTSRVLPLRSFARPTLLFPSILSLFLCFSSPSHSHLGHVWKHPVIPSVPLLSKLCCISRFLSITVSVSMASLRADHHPCRHSVHTGAGTRDILSTCSGAWSEGAFSCPGVRWCSAPAGPHKVLLYHGHEKAP